MNNQLIFPTILLVSFVLLLWIGMRSLRPKRTTRGLRRKKLKNEIDNILKKNKDGF